MSQPKKPPETDEERRAARRARERHYRKMRAKGLRRVTTWVIDTRDPAFVEECRRWSRAVSAGQRERTWFEPWSDAQDFPDWKA